MKTSTKPIYIEMSDPQLEFTNMRCRYPLFVAAYGAGKTACMAINALNAVARCPDGIYAIYEPTYRLIDSVAKPEIEKWLDYTKCPHTYNKAASKFHGLPNGAEIWFISMEDLASIVGFESNAGCGIDEIEQLPIEKQDEAFKRCNARIRGPRPPGFVSQCRVYTTPDFGVAGITYQKWGMNAALPDAERIKRAQFQFVTATSESNVKNTGQDYIDNLMSLYSGKARDVYVYGKWVNLANGLVYEAYDRVQNRSSETVTDRDNALYIGMDFNVGHMAAIVNVRRPNPNLGSTYTHQYHAVREFVDLPDTPAMITRLKQEYPRQRLVIYPDCAGVSRKSVDASISDITLLQQAGFQCHYHPSHPAVKDRVLAMNRALRQKDLMINDELCPVLAKNMAEQAYNDKGEPSKANNIDHPLDAQGYLIEFEMPIRRRDFSIVPTYGRF